MCNVNHKILETFYCFLSFFNPPQYTQTNCSPRFGIYLGDCRLCLSKSKSSTSSGMWIIFKSCELIIKLEKISIASASVECLLNDKNRFKKIESFYELSRSLKL